MKNVGILVPNNDLVLSTMKAFNDLNFPCEFKYNAGYNDKRNRVTLDFTTTLPKLMTYHSAKGLQFETVILPFYEGANDKEKQKALSLVQPSCDYKDLADCDLIIEAALENLKIKYV